MAEENREKILEERAWWHESGLRFSCRECGKCCGGEPGDIWVTPDETKNIAEFLKITEREFAEKYLRGAAGRVSIKDVAEKNYDCIFLDSETRHCKIYSVRPRQCSLFPFWRSMLEDKEEWDYYSARCPGMDSGRAYTAEEITEKLKKQLIDGK
jgi:Fe-S-cluster containining protein